MSQCFVSWHLGQVHSHSITAGPYFYSERQIVLDNHCTGQSLFLTKTTLGNGPKNYLLGTRFHHIFLNKSNERFYFLPGAGHILWWQWTAILPRRTGLILSRVNIFPQKSALGRKRSHLHYSFQSQWTTLPSWNWTYFLRWQWTTTLYNGELADLYSSQPFFYKAGDWAAINGIYIILANSNGNSNSLWNWILLVMANSNWQMAGFSFLYGNGPQYFQCDIFMMSDSFIHGAWAIDSTFHSWAALFRNFKSQTLLFHRYEWVKIIDETVVQMVWPIL